MYPGLVSVGNHIKQVPVAASADFTHKHLFSVKKYKYKNAEQEPHPKPSMKTAYPGTIS